MAGVVCESDSFLSVYAPDCVKSVPIGEEDEQRLVGMIVKKELTCERISLVNIDKNKIIEDFNSLYFHIDYGYFNRESFLSFSKNLFSNNGKALEIQSSIVEKNAPVLKGLKDSSKCNYYLLLNLYYDNNIINKTAKAIKDENFKSNLIDNFIYLNCFLKLIEPFNLDTSKYESLYLKVEPTKEYVDKFYSIIKPLENIINI